MIAMKEFDKDTLKKWKVVLNDRQQKTTPEEYLSILKDLKEFFEKVAMEEGKDKVESIKGIIDGINCSYRLIMEAKNEAKT